MKKLFLALTGISLALLTSAQQKEGKVMYERTMQMQLRMNDNDPMAQMLPKTRTDKFELNYGEEPINMETCR